MRVYIELFRRHNTGCAGTVDGRTSLNPHSSEWRREPRHLAETVPVLKSFSQKQRRAHSTQAIRAILGAEHEVILIHHLGPTAALEKT